MTIADVRPGTCSLILLVVAFGRLPSVTAEPPKPLPRLVFTDASEPSGIAGLLRGAYIHAIAWGDVDGDGLADVFIGNFADRSPKFGMAEPPRNMLLRQNAPGRFERWPSPPVEVAARCSGGVFADFDNDGDLDLYVTSNTLTIPTREGARRTPQLHGCNFYRNEGKGAFVDVSAASGACPPTLVRCRDVGVLDYDGDGLLDLLVMQDFGVSPDDKPAGAQLFRNRGDLTFQNVSREAGLTDELWAAGLAIADLNGDRLPDVYLCGSNRLLLSQPDRAFREADSLRELFNPAAGELDWVTGAAFGDLDGDGDFDLITGRHHYYGSSRVHVFLNDGLRDAIPQFREITSELGIQPLPQKAPHPEIQDFDNDGHVDLYWSAFFADRTKREPFVCRGLGVDGGLPRFAVPPTPREPVLTDGKVQNVLPETGRGMVYYVCGPAVDFDNDGDLDFLLGIWPDEPSRLLRNDTQGGNWLEVTILARTGNRMGVGTQVQVFHPGQADEPEALLGVKEITLNGGYASTRPAVVHFGLGDVEKCDVVVRLPRPASAEPVVFRNVAVNQRFQATDAPPSVPE